MREVKIATAASVSIFQRVSFKERTFVARQLAVMIDAGLPLSQAVRLLGEQTKSPQMTETLKNILRDLENGYSFSNSLRKHPKVFNSVFTSVVAAGEQTGKLDTVLNMLADEQEREQGFRRQLLGALLYPAFIVVAMIVVGLIMVTRIVPALEQVFNEANVPLPWTTRTVVVITNSLINYWYYYLAGLALLVFLFIRYTSTEDGRRSFNAFVLRVPVLKVLINNLEMSRFTRIFGMMIEAGVPVIQTIEAVAEVMDNLLYQEALAGVAHHVERGSPISQSLSRYPVFPKSVIQMVAVGEQTGKLDKIFHKLAEYYEAETNAAIKAISSLVEPIVFVIVGLGVAFIVFSIIVPIYQLANVIT